MLDRVCIFIDGENLRFSIAGLFPKHYKATHYLPHADWKSFLEVIIELASKEIGKDLTLIRAYWYVISEIQYNDYFEHQKFPMLPKEKKIEYFKKHASSMTLNTLPGNKQEAAFSEELEKCFNLLTRNSSYINAQFKSWKVKESAIQKQTNRLQFQRFGYLKVYLDDGKGKVKLKEEKGVDIKLATDLMALKDIYDVAIVISGDGDYIPAVNAIKNMGKQVIVVDFKNKKGNFLPGGSFKLKEHCDFSFSIDHDRMLEICGYEKE